MTNTATKRSLLDISNDYQDFFGLMENIDLDEVEATEQEQLNAFIADLNNERDKKLDNIGAYVKDLDARVIGRDQIIKQMEKGA